jgi:hypothetical protein
MKTTLPFKEAVVAVMPDEFVKANSVFADELSLTASFFISALNKPTATSCCSIHDFASGLTITTSTNAPSKIVTAFFLLMYKIYRVAYFIEFLFLSLPSLLHFPFAVWYRVPVNLQKLR